jgi:hypothetical protein
MTENTEKRKHSRITINRFLDCVVTIEGLGIQAAILKDLSAGGLLLLADQPLGAGTLKAGARVSGTVDSADIALTMKFTGTIAWERKTEIHNEIFTAIGINFDEDVLLPEALYDR